MEITTVFQKERREFGRPTTHFAPSESIDLGGFDCDIGMRDKYIERNPCVLEIQAIPSQSEHQVARSALAPQLARLPGVCRMLPQRPLPFHRLPTRVCLLLFTPLGAGSRVHYARNGVNESHLPAPQVNTERFTYNSIGMFHMEGGWPKDIDATEKEQTTCAAPPQLDLPPATAAAHALRGGLLARAGVLHRLRARGGVAQGNTGGWIRRAVHRQDVRPRLSCPSWAHL
jgi:hypothetical protein